MRPDRIVGPLGDIEIENDVGVSQPFGVSLVGGKTLNFSVRAPNAEKVKLVLYFDKDEKKNDSLTEPTIQIDMNEARENGGDGGIFTIQIRRACHFEARGTGIECLDIIRGRISNVSMIRWYSWIHTHPWFLRDGNISGKNIKLKTKKTDRTRQTYWTYDFKSKPFDWANVDHPRINDEDLVIYETTVRAFTKEDESLNDNIRGSFLAIAEK